MAEDSTEYMRTQRAVPKAEPEPPGDDEASAGGDEAPGRAPVEEGRFIGRYRIRERIGEGGMGVVYAADDPDLGRVVAIKLLRPVEGSEGEVHQRRMLREAQALARVSHANLVTVYDVGTHDGRVWIAMEYVVGETLDAWLRRTRRSWREIVDVFIEAGRGLAAVHAANLVHRDFKPGNVLVGEQGTVQVLDFGLAARTGESAPDESSDGRARPDLDALAATLTTTGGIMGTPAYMAPEQFLRLGADARADQFAFCVALYEALYGRRPWKGRDLGELMVAVVGGLTERPPALPGVPEAIRTALTRGLRAEADERYPDMSALLAVLEDARAPRQPRSGGWSRIVLGMILGGGVLGLGARQWVAADEPEPEAPNPVEMAPQDDREEALANDEAAREEEPAQEDSVVVEVPSSEARSEDSGDTGETWSELATGDVFAELPGVQDLEDATEGGTGTGGDVLAGLPALEPDAPEHETNDGGDEANAPAPEVTVGDRNEPNLPVGLVEAEEAGG
jgi:serine/threonine protein kinase